MLRDENDDENYSNNAISRCLSLPEIVYEIGSHLLDPGDLCAASQCNRLWNETLVPLRMAYPHVNVEYVDSFLEYLKSNEHAAHHCQSLRIIADDAEEEDEDSEDAPDAINDILNKVVNDNGLTFFMYALPGEPFKPLADSIWATMQEKLTKSLRGLYIEVHRRHWANILSSQFTHLTYLRLFLESDDRESLPSDFPPQFDPKQALLTFLNQHTGLQTLHLYLGNDYADLDLSPVFLPTLYSFLLISKAENVQIQKFLENHKSLRALDCYTDTEIKPFDAQVLPNLRALQVSALTIHWYKELLAENASRETPIRHLQISSAQELNFAYVAQHINPLGSSLRCLELIFWSRDVQLMNVLDHVNELFPQLVELSLFIPAWGTEADSEGTKPFELGPMLEHFAGSKHFRALSVSDPTAAYLSDKLIVDTLKSEKVPQNLTYIIWRAQTFRVMRTDEELVVRKQYHPRNYRGSQWKRDWPDEMVFDHVREDYY